MSYEGYEEFVCPEGHYWTAHAMDVDHAARNFTVCAICSKTARFVNSVDMTNGYQGGKLIMYPNNNPCVCECGNVHKSGVPTYSLVFDENGRPKREEFEVPEASEKSDGY